MLCSNVDESSLSKVHSSQISPMSSLVASQPRLLNRRRPDPPAANEASKVTVKVFPVSDVSIVAVDSDDDDEIDVKNHQWRQYGQKRRQDLVDNDKAATSFRMNAACSIKKYFALSERVIAQFQDLFDQNMIEDAYVMGHRLIAFLGTALPRHPAYATSVAQRTVTEHQLQRIKITMKRISILIDEEQLNRYITNDFDPLIEDEEEDGDDLLHSSLDDFLESTPTSWETFAEGWSFNTDGTPGFADTDESSQDIDSDIDFTDLDLTKQRTTRTIGVDKLITDSPTSDSFNDDTDDDSDDGRTDPFAMRMKPPVLAQSILRKIAREAVRYESDSEAADSWAQDGNCSASEATSSSEVGDAATTTSNSPHHNHNSPREATTVPFLSCDPARLAFRSIMNRHTRNLQSLQVEMESLLSVDPLPFHPQPKNFPPTFDVDLPCVQRQSIDTEEEKKDDELNQDDQEDERSYASKPEPEFDALTLTLSLSLPPPVISAPHTLDPQYIDAMVASKAVTVSESPTFVALLPRDESPFRPETTVPNTPHNSPEEADFHRVSSPSVVSNRWGVQLRCTSQQQKRVSPTSRVRHQQHSL